MATKKTVRKTTAKSTAKKAPAKKVVKKTPVKKAVKDTKKVTKKAPAKKVSKKELVYADIDRSFWTTNGQVLNSLLALRDALEQMETEVYYYHAGEAHNDFANWVDQVLCDGACASELQKAKTPDSAKKVVVKHLKAYVI